MNMFIKLWVMALLFSCCKGKDKSPTPVKPFDNALAATWKMVSVTTKTGTVTTNPTDKELFTEFQRDTNTLTFENAGTMGSGKYTLSVGNSISISVLRADRGGWPNGPWLDLYLEKMNKSSSYQIIENQLKIVVNDGSTILFTK